MVAVPLPAPVPRHQQQVGPRQARQGGSASTASHNGPDMRVSTALRVRNVRCAPEIRASNSDSRYSLTSRSSPPNETAAVPTEPPSRRYSAARYSPTGHPSVRSCSAATSSSPTVTSAARSNAAASPRVSARSAGPTSVIRPSARSLAIRSGGAVRPASASRDPAGTCSASTESAARHSELCSRCTSSRASTTGEVIDSNAAPNRGTTEPGTELTGEASASNTRWPTGSTWSSACAM